MEPTPTPERPDVPSSPQGSSSPTPQKPQRSWFWAANALILAAFVGATTWVLRPRPAADGNAASAEDGATLGFDVFRHPESSPAESHLVHDHDTVHATDGFTFELHNRSAKETWVMLFGMDTRDTMYWFFPQADPQKHARSIPLGRVPSAVIPEGVTPSGVPAGVFRIVGLFSNEPLDINEVEDAYRQHGPQKFAEELHATLQLVSVQIE